MGSSRSRQEGRRSVLAAMVAVAVAVALARAADTAASPLTPVPRAYATFATLERYVFLYLLSRGTILVPVLFLQWEDQNN